MNKDLDNIKDWAHQWLVKFSPAKTKLMTATFKKKDHAPIIFNNVTLANVDSHKHLGLILTSNLTWTEHISNLIKSVSQMANVMKNLKYQIDRKSLETSYFSFIRPKLEYGCHIWDNCSKKDSDMLENFQLDIARTVTGARKGTSHEKLYMETNWPTLKERRNAIKLKNFMKIINNDTPNYLTALLPDTLGVTRPGSRNADHFKLVKTRTETYRNSFIPSSVKVWNQLDSKDRTVNYVHSLCDTKTNPLFYEGSRDINVKHSQLRMECSKLNAHLFSLHVTDSPACNCGFNLEDCNHYLLACPLYTVERHIMLQTISNVIDVRTLTVNDLLLGIDKLTLEQNKLVFKAVHEFIRATSRL